jgi:hypothetical protein
MRPATPVESARSRRRIRRRLERLTGDQRQTCEREHPDEHAPSGATSDDPAHGPPVGSWIGSRQDHPRPLSLPTSARRAATLRRERRERPRTGGAGPSPGQMPISPDPVTEGRKAAPCVSGFPPVEANFASNRDFRPCPRCEGRVIVTDREALHTDRLEDLRPEPWRCVAHAGAPAPPPEGYATRWSDEVASRR